MAEGERGPTTVTVVAVAGAGAALSHPVSDALTDTVGTRTDNRTITFAAATVAVEQALDIARTAAGRIGVDSGEIAGGTDHAPPIRRAQALSEHAGSGQVLLTEVSRLLLPQPLPAGLDVAAAGVLEEGTGPAVTVHMLTHDDLPPAAVPAGLRPQQVPAPTTPLVGRALELQRVSTALDTDRLVTITGPGGAGKSRLAVAIAHAACQRVAWVDLGAVSHDTELLATVGRALGVQTVDPVRATAALAQALRVGDGVLLVLDRCEHVVDAAARLVVDLLRDVGDLAVLVTSQRSLGTPGEVVVPLGGLSEDDAAALFRDRAQRVGSTGDRAGPQDTAVIAELCQRLDGIPLALELAAARTRTMSPEAVLRAVDDRFQLLSGGSRALPGRQRSMEATCAWGYDLLDPPAQRLLARVSVFPGSFSADMAAAVCADDDAGGELDTAAVRGLLEELVHRSLVVPLARDDRFRLLDTIREFALLRLDEAGEREGVHGRLIAHALAWAPQAAIGMVTDPERWEPMLAQELPLLLHALRTAGPSQVITLAELLGGFLGGLGHMAAVLTPLERATGSAVVTDEERGRALNVAGALATYFGDFSAGYAHAKAAFAAVGDGGAGIRAHAHALHAWTGLFSTHGSNEQIASDRMTALELLDDVDTRSLRTSALIYLGTVAGLTDVQEGRALLERALTEATDAGSPLDAMHAQTFLAQNAIFGGRFDEARSRSRMVIDGLNASGVPLLTSFALSQLAAGESMAGMGDRSLELAREAERLALRSRLRGQRLFAMRSCGMAQLARDDCAAAAAELRRALEAHALVDAGLERGYVLLLSGMAAMGLQDVEDAEHHLGQALALSADPTIAPLLGMAQAELASLASDSGDRARAIDLVHSALATLDGSGERWAALESLRVAARVAAADDPELAARLLGAARGAAAQLGVAPFPYQARREEQTARSLQNLLEGDYETLLAEGAAMSVDRAIALARRGRGSRPRAHAGWEALTPTELEVARLVAQGLKNGDIAAQLFVTTNTVKTHLSSAYRKLGTSSRTELAAEVTRRGL